jgi:diguanylate cyclase (GGDEF)-like protein
MVAESINLKKILCKLPEKERDLIYALIEKDPLTGAYNRRRLRKDLHLMASKTERYNKGCGLLIIDVDYFKIINDDLGHLEGDRRLRDVVKCTESILRDYDIMHIYRYGGDEFIVIIADASLHDTLTIGERIRTKIGTSCSISVSIGVSHYKEISDHIDDLLLNADMALSEAKRRGRDKVVTLYPSEKNLFQRSMIDRSTRDRRSGKDRRQVYDLEYFFKGGAERRSRRNRRGAFERRTGWMRIGKWRSIPTKRKKKALLSTAFDPCEADMFPEDNPHAMGEPSLPSKTKSV